MERLLEPDEYISHKFPEFIFNGDFGYASGAQEGGYYRIWFKEELRQDEISFDSDVYLLLPAVAKELSANAAQPKVIVGPIEPQTPQPPGEIKGPLFPPPAGEPIAPTPSKRTITIRGEIPTEVWNRLGRTLIPKLKMGGGELTVALSVSVEVEADNGQGFQQELIQILRDLNLADAVKIEMK